MVYPHEPPGSHHLSHGKPSGGPPRCSSPARSTCRCTPPSLSRHPTVRTILPPDPVSYTRYRPLAPGPEREPRGVALSVEPERQRLREGDLELVLAALDLLLAAAALAATPRPCPRLRFVGRCRETTPLCFVHSASASSEGRIGKRNSHAMTPGPGLKT